MSQTDLNVCKICDREIKQMCRKGTGICGELCQKVSETQQKK